MSSVLQVCVDFIAEHADRKVTKKWVHTTVKEIAERDNGQWSVTAQALADAGKREHAGMLYSLLLAMSALTSACLTKTCIGSVLFHIRSFSQKTSLQRR